MFSFHLVNRILKLDAHNVKALQMLSIISAAKDGDIEKVVDEQYV